MKKSAVRPNPPGYEPLKLAPSGVKQKLARKAARTATSLRAAIEIKCIECCAWNRTEARNCEINTCALWASNRRIFKRGA